MKKIGIIAIIVKDRTVANQIQCVLSDYADIIIGRMGIPEKEHNIHAISVIVEGENERISALSGKLGRINNVAVKSAVTSVELD